MTTFSGIARKKSCGYTRISKTYAQQRNSNDQPATRMNTGLAGRGPRRQAAARSITGLRADDLKRYT